MIRTCKPSDPFIGDGDQRCGMTFDDVEHSTICPHPRLPTHEEKAAWLEEHMPDLAEMYRSQHS